MSTSLKINLRTVPDLRTIGPEETHTLLDALIDEFDDDFQRRCKEKNLPGGRLLPGERSLMKNFILFLTIRTPEEP